MKTTEVLQKEIKELTKRCPEVKPSKNKELLKEWAFCQKRIKWIRQCILYLEHLPSEEFLSNQKARKEKELVSIDQGFDEWELNTPCMLRNPKSKSIYNAYMGRKKVYDHLNTLEYLLK